MTSEFTAGRRGPTAIHPGVQAAVTAVYDALLDLMATLPQPPDPASPARRGAEFPQPLSLLPLDPAAPRLDPPFALPPAVDASPLGRLRDALSLTPFETALLALALLPELNTRCKATIGYLQGNPRDTCPTPYLALRLFAPDDPDPARGLHALRPTVPLRVWELLTPPPEDAATIEYPLRLERALHWYLLGDDTDGRDPEVAGLARRAPTAAPPAVDLPEVLGYLLHPAHHAVGPILLYGAAAPAALAVALAAARGRGQDLLLLDGERLAREGKDGPRLLRRGVREALLRGLLPCVRAAAPVLRRGAPQEEAYREVLDACPCPVLLLGDGEEDAYAAGDGSLCAVAIPAPDAPTRLTQWQRAAAREGIAADTPALRVLAETTALCGPALDAAAALARGAAEGQGEQPTATHLQRAARGVLRDGDVPLEPRFGWDDLVLPPVQLAQLRHLCNRVRYRSRVREEWDLGHGTLPGVSALFTGAPGTGKSLAAEVVAADLGLALFKVDLSQTVSKYIGETEKTLGALFDAAERLGVALVFDEADALFGKRSAVTDSHDRYANLETSYLLQRLERFSGLALLTTNLGANLDEAFTRRLAVSVDFPLPGAADRLRLWERLLGRAPRDPALDLRVLAERVELAGGAIMGAAVTAGYLAAEAGGVIDGACLAQAVRWELRKAGRLVDNAALDALLPAPDDREGANGIVYPRR